jgi:imidazolonepropionase-like amidohydrolase
MSRIKSILVFTGLAACMTAEAPVATESQEGRSTLLQFDEHNRHQTGRPVAITNVRIFDGEHVIPRGNVVIWGQSIWHVGEKDKIPSGSEVIDGSGATLMPGFIDSHAHDSGFGVERAPIFGVTTELEMFGDPEIARILREEQAQTGAPGKADLITAGTLATAPGGHGTQYGIPIPTLTQPDQARPWVDDRIEEGSDFIKIVLEDGSPFGFRVPFPTLDRATTGALIDAAHRRHKLAVVHVSEESYATMAIQENADGLVHISFDNPPTPQFIALAAARKVFVAPTLTVLESATGIASGESLTHDPHLAPYLTAEEIENLRFAFPNRGGLTLDGALSAVAQLKAAGVPILAGSDSPNPGTAWGVSIHREMELLVMAGLSPTEALRAATSAPADAFRLKDRGRIAKGLRADLVLVNGHPDADIMATRDILRVWKLGMEIARTPVAAGTTSVALRQGFESGRAHAHTH